MILFFLLSVFGKNGRNASEEANLVAMIAKKDQQALSRLYDLYAKLLFSLIYKVVGKQETAEDILQEIFVMVWEKAAMFDPSKGSVYTWLAAMSRNKSIDYLRSKANKNQKKHVSEADEHIFPILESEGMNPLDATIQNERSTMVRQALDGLPEEQKTIIAIAYFKGYTQSEIAEEFNLPLGTVKTRMRQGMIKLKDLLTATV